MKGLILKRGDPLTYTSYELLWLFVIYSFSGWCIEVIFAAANTGRFVNRGFLNGPVCPIYGGGAVILLLLLEPFEGRILLLFIGTVVLTSLLELIVGFFLKKLFHQRWWDYSEEPFNVGGYICLKFSLLWGIGGVVIIEAVQPSIMSLIHVIPQAVGMVFLCVIYVLFSVDTVITVATIQNFNNRLRLLEEVSIPLRSISDEIGSNLSENVIDLLHLAEDLKEKAEDWREKADEVVKDRTDDIREAYQKYIELLEAKPFGQERLMKAFPRMRSLDYPEILEKLKEQLESKWKKKEENS